MLELKIPGKERYDEVNCEFIYTQPTVIKLEHSLVSLYKWESKWNRAFLGRKDMSYEETIDYIRCMTITQNVDPNVYYGLTNENIEKVSEYIQAPMTATHFYEDPDKPQAPNREVVTAELIYYWMIALNIPFECQRWHLNKLLTLIKVCNIKNTPPKKLGKRGLMNRNRALNEMRKNSLNTNG